MKNLTIISSTLKTKDAFWHSENVIVKDITIEGAYLGWYAKNITLINCKIKGTQPFCYTDNLKIMDCTFEDADLAFEYSSIDAKIKGHMISIKNPKSGHITLDTLGDLIQNDSKYNHHDTKITIKSKEVSS